MPNLYDLNILGSEVQPLENENTAKKIIIVESMRKMA